MLLQPLQSCLCPSRYFCLFWLSAVMAAAGWAVTVHNVPSVKYSTFLFRCVVEGGYGEGQCITVNQ